MAAAVEHSICGAAAQTKPTLSRLRCASDIRHPTERSKIRKMRFTDAAQSQRRWQA